VLRGDGRVLLVRDAGEVGLLDERKSASTVQPLGLLTVLADGENLRCTNPGALFDGEKTAIAHNRTTIIAAIR